MRADVPDGDSSARHLPREFWQAPRMKGITNVAVVHRLRDVVPQADSFLGLYRTAIVRGVPADVSGRAAVPHPPRSAIRPRIPRTTTRSSAPDV